MKTAAEGNVVARFLAEGGVAASVRTVQRAVADRRRMLRSADRASVRFDTAPGQQIRMDFGERRIWIADQRVKVALPGGGAEPLAPGLRGAFLRESFCIRRTKVVHGTSGRWLPPAANVLAGGTG